MKLGWIGLVAVLVVFGVVNERAMARDRLAHGYSSASGVFAGLWVAEEGKIFEKYDIDSHLILIASGSLMVQAMLGGELPYRRRGGKRRCRCQPGRGGYRYVRVDGQSSGFLHYGATGDQNDR